MAPTKSKADRRVLILFYLLILYIGVQFAWWAYMLIKLNKALYTVPEELLNKIWMVVGEGSVFLIFLCAGAYIMQRSIRKEMALVRQQRNFLLSITHELKTPLAAIKLCIETLEKHKKLSLEEQSVLQNNALSNTDRLSSLIDKVLLATRIESGQKLIQNSNIDLAELTNQIVKRFKDSKLTGNRIIEVSTDEMNDANVDPQYYDSILSNLFENAIKYGGDGAITVALKNKPGLVELRVSDQGPGISQKNKFKIFDKFFREGNEETRTKKGTGLGLFIVKKLVELHHGTISLSNNHPQGCVFTVTFPN